MPAQAPNQAAQHANETISTLTDRLVALSLKDGRAKSRPYFAARVDQSAVDDWNAFMRRSNAYHSVGTVGEEAALKSYMGDLKKQYQRCVKGEAPPSGVSSWEVYFKTCSDCAEAVRQKAHQIAILRAEALRSAEAIRAVERGLFSDRSWLNHVDQIINHSKAHLGLDTISNSLMMYGDMWQTQQVRYRADPKGYKFPKFEWEAYEDWRARELGRWEDNEALAETRTERAGRQKAAERKREQRAREIEEKFAAKNEALDRQERAR